LGPPPLPQTTLDPVCGASEPQILPRGRFERVGLGMGNCLAV
jgi:hypothetical protein